MTERSRIEKVMEHFEMNARQFAASIDLNPSTLSHVLSGRNNASLDIMQKILKKYPNLNPAWLILGEDSMFRKRSDSHTLNLFDFDDSTRYISDQKQTQKEEINNTQQDQIRTMREATPHSSDHKAAELPTRENVFPLQAPPKAISKIIVYYSDNTFEELQK